MVGRRAWCGSEGEGLIEFVVEGDGSGASGGGMVGEQGLHHRGGLFGGWGNVGG